MNRVRGVFLVRAAFMLSLILLATPAEAQLGFGLDARFGSDVSLEISPAAPSPGDTVVVKAKSMSIPLSEAEVSWYVNGKKTAGETDETETTVVAGALGSETVVRVVVSHTESTAEATIRIRPTELDLLWEADSYVPPFFKGRALPSAGTSLRFEAIPRFQKSGGALMPVKDIVFTWRRNGYAIPNTSGRGKSSVSIASPSLFGVDTISVEARSLDGVFVTEGAVRIPAVEPHLVLYQNHPLFGIQYHAAIGEQSFIPQTEVSLAATPYYAAIQEPDDPALLYEWKVNGQSIGANPEHPSSLTINASGSSGTARVELALSHATNFFFSAFGSWNLTLVGDASISSDPFTTP